MCYRQSHFSDKHLESLDISALMPHVNKTVKNTLFLGGGEKPTPKQKPDKLALKLRNQLLRNKTCSFDRGTSTAAVSINCYVLQLHSKAGPMLTQSNASWQVEN